MRSTETESFPGRLEIIGGKLATFEKTGGRNSKGKIVLKYVQGSEPNVTVYRVTQRRMKDVYLAFCFEKNKKKYVLGVEKEKICFEVNAHNKINEFTQKFLFRWNSNKGAFGTLSPVAEPRRYLYVQEKPEVTISNKSDCFFKIVTKYKKLQKKRSGAISMGNVSSSRMLRFTMKPTIRVKKKFRKRKLKP